MVTRQEVQSHKDTIYVFGDNVVRLGYGGQAKECRGEPNCIGIPTKWSPYEYFSNKDLDIVKGHIDAAIKKILQRKNEGYKIVVLPKIGEGLADLPNKAPLIYAYLKIMLKRIM